MCGIVGYIGSRPVLAVLLEGLRRLEYRGYDSAGVVFWEGETLKAIKSKGKVYNLEEKIYQEKLNPSSPGLGHTRWATHGEPSEFNAHPHFDCEKKIAVVHNGIIENYYDLKKFLKEKGHKFISETDTEVVAHLIEECLRETPTFFHAFMRAINLLEGAFALACISLEEPDKIYVARWQSPLVVGFGEGENFIASDIPALLSFTRRVIYLDDGEWGVITKDRAHFYDFHGNTREKLVHYVSWDLASAEKGGFPHFMLKEIYEQPEALKQTLLGRLNLSQKRIDFYYDGLSPEFFNNLERIYLVACGTSYHACLVGKYLWEKVVPWPIEVEIASEFRYRQTPLHERSLLVVLSQSGETADTLACVKIAKARGAKVLSICNVVGSSIARESDVVLYTQAGPEISVASTKAFTSQVLMLIMLSVFFAELFHSSSVEETVKALINLPSQTKMLLDKVHPFIREVAIEWHGASNFLYLGRNILYPIALEGALKLKEISYIHAEGYAAGEMKHGPIALVDEKFPIILLTAKELGIIHEKTISNAEEIKARRGPLLVLTTEGTSELADKCNAIFYLPSTIYALIPILYVIPLQLLAYEIANFKGCDIDKPRNLAKSVTVE